MVVPAVTVFISREAKTGNWFWLEKRNKRKLFSSCRWWTNINCRQLYSQESFSVASEHVNGDQLIPSHLNVVITVRGNQGIAHRHITLRKNAKITCYMHFSRTISLFIPLSNIRLIFFQVLYDISVRIVIISTTIHEWICLYGDNHRSSIIEKWNNVLWEQHTFGRVCWHIGNRFVDGYLQFMVWKQRDEWKEGKIYDSTDDECGELSSLVRITNSADCCISTSNTSQFDGDMALLS